MDFQTMDIIESAPSRDTQAPLRHKKYYFPDGSIIILVSFYLFILGMQNVLLSLSVWPYTL